MQCPKCQFKNPDYAKFCMECGHNFQEHEHGLSIDFTQPHSYTPKFLADKILTSRSAMEGERKRVTVLFADVAGFTSMSEKLDPEQVHQIMDGCFKILMDEIHNHQGTINQFTGDGVMALFGAPVAIENHAQNACQAALSIQSAIKNYSTELATKFGLDFKMRIGLNSGPVIVGTIGDDLRMDYTAIGDTVNLASRMESMAEPGTILISDITYKRVSQFFKFEPLGKVTVKGKEDPLDAYKLAGKIERPASGLERQIFSEMVGRDNDLNKLELQVTKAVNGEGSIVNVIGEAGIGKSRLIAELRNSSVMKRITLLEGRAISIGRNLSFHPIINLLKHWAQINDKDTSVSALSKLETAIRSVCPDDTNEIFPFVATLMGMKPTGRHLERVSGIEGEALEKLIFKNLRDLLIKSTELTSLIVVIEDLHWADTSSIELLESLFRLAETRRIVFINVFRPNHPETGDRVIETIKEKLPVYYVEIRLQPLSEQMGETLINNMLKIKGLQQAVVDQIIQRSGGNPFFIEEVVRSFIDTGAVVRANGEFKVTEKIENMVIPYTINDVLMARIDRLDENTRDLVKVASVIGRSFFYRILTEVANTVDGIDKRLSYLKQIELICERQRMEELEYLFKHALAQETAYESILFAKRKELHLNVANSFQKIFSEKLHEFYGMLAYHYSKGEDATSAQKFLLKAGEEALSASASSEALKYYQEALKLYLAKYGDAGEASKISMMQKNIAIALYNKGQYAEAVEYFDEALVPYWGRLPKHIIPLLLKFGKWFLHYLFALYFPSLKFHNIPDKRDNEFIKLFYMKSEMLAQTDPTRFFIESFYMLEKLTTYDLTKVQNGIGMFAGSSAVFSYAGISLKLSRKVLDFVKGKVDKQDEKSKLYYEMVKILHDYLAGEFSSVKEFDDDLLNRNLSKGVIYYSMIYTCYHAFISIDQGRPKDTQQKISKMFEVADLYEHDFARVVGFEVKIRFLVKYRRIHDALEALKKGIPLASRTGLELYFSCFNIYKALIMCINKDFESATACLNLAMGHKNEIEEIPSHRITLLQCQFTISLNNLKKAIMGGNLKKIKKAKETAQEFGKKTITCSKKVITEQSESMRLLGTYYWLLGKQKKALKWWSKAIKKAEELGARPNLSRTYFEVGKALLDPKCKHRELNGITAEQYLEKAKTMFEEMDLQWDLDELDKVMASL